MLLFRKFADKQGFGGFMQVGRSKAKVYMEKETGVTGDDSQDDQAKAGIEVPSEVAEDKTDVPTPSVGNEVQSKDDKSAE
jgi:hypothetical protein